MGRYQEYEVHFKCQNGKIDSLLDLCYDAGLDIDKAIIGNPDVNTKVTVDMSGGGSYSNLFYDILAELKQKLIDDGAEDISIRIAELIEVEPLKPTGG